MGATTTEGTGHGSVPKVLPPIFNGVVKYVNLEEDILKNYIGNLGVTGNITATGDIESSNDLIAGQNVEVADNISAGGWIRGGASGQLVNTFVQQLSNGDVTTSNGTLLLLHSLNYTPKSDVNVNLIIEFHSDYEVAGAGAGSGDSFKSTITIGEVTVASRTQHWGAASGTGTRSATVFPIVGLFNQTGTTALPIHFNIQKTVGDDTLTIHRSGAVVRISEYIA